MSRRGGLTRFGNLSTTCSRCCCSRSMLSRASTPRTADRCSPRPQPHPPPRCPRRTRRARRRSSAAETGALRRSRRSGWCTRSPCARCQDGRAPGPPRVAQRAPAAHCTMRSARCASFGSLVAPAPVASLRRSCCCSAAGGCSIGRLSRRGQSRLPLRPARRRGARAPSAFGRSRGTRRPSPSKSVASPSLGYGGPRRCSRARSCQRRRGAWLGRRSRRHRWCAPSTSASAA
mmetsp:Transcript_24962/g.80098  ORF Transcript_24962/g.80098 Transcript_24962/m.80098 type:complete len:232 (-) Transcript_24962:696-1391(-)